jgi:hypothetical protein
MTEVGVFTADRSAEVVAITSGLADNQCKIKAPVRCWLREPASSLKKSSAKVTATVRSGIARCAWLNRLTCVRVFTALRIM